MANLFRALAIVGVVLASGAAIAGDSNDEAKPDPRIGKEVDRICFASSINGWKSIKGEDDVVLLEKGANDWYRVELMGMCDDRDLRSAMTIGIESRPAGGCLTRGDVILVRGPGGFVNRCHISKMYEWNEDAKAPEVDEDDEEGDDDGA